MVLEAKIFEDGRTIKEMGLAPHRFNSTEKPLVRASMTQPELRSVAQAIWQLRGPTTREGGVAVAFLKLLDCEKGVLQGMMVDGGCEALTVPRAWEPESSSMAMFQESAQHFLKAAVVLFKHRKCLTFGFHSHCNFQVERKGGRAVTAR